MEKEIGFYIKIIWCNGFYYVPLYMNYERKIIVDGIEITVISSKKLEDGDITKIQGRKIDVAHIEPIKNRFVSKYR